MSQNIIHLNPVDFQAKPETELPAYRSKFHRILMQPRFMLYNRYMALVLIVNLVVLANAVTVNNWFSSGGIDLASLSNMALINFSMGIFFRQQYVINLLFKMATSVPTSAPLGLRWFMGKVYHFGGFHVGGAIAGSVWFALFVGGIIFNRVNGLAGVSDVLFGVTLLIMTLLMLIIGTAAPQVRQKRHDRFERVHRLGGWTLLGLFWAQTVLFIGEQQAGVSLGSALVNSPSFWLLAALTFSIALPWLRLRRVPVKISTPSSHVALAHFDYGVTPFAGSSTALSTNPLLEWHSFANVPSPGETGYRLTISRAGDWTGKFIDEKPSHVWVKGIPTAGVGNVDKLFKRVVWIATGSGIGPCLPHLLSQEVPAHLVWSTRTPRETYGDQLVDEILDVQPNAVIWDTNANGRPDLVKLAYEAVQDFDAEAVIVISNQKLTRLVVYEMESRGIPAFGAIWDS